MAVTTREGGRESLPFSENVLRDRLVDLREKHNVPTIKHGPRHSFASYWLAMHGDINQLCRFLGHDDPQTTFRHYAKAATKREAQKFWAVMPKKAKLPKVICISAGGHSVKVDGFLSERSLFVHPLNEKGEEATPADCFRYASRWAWELWKLARHDKEAQKS